MITHADYKRALQSFQSQRLRRDLADLAAEAQYELLGRFFFEEMYGPRDFSARDEQAQRVHRFIRHTPGVTIHDVEPVLTLLELTYALDDTIVNLLVRLNAPLDFDEATYEHAYHLADNYAERMTQLNLVVVALGNVHRLGRKPLLPCSPRSGQVVMSGLSLPRCATSWWWPTPYCRPSTRERPSCTAGFTSRTPRVPSSACWMD